MTIRDAIARVADGHDLPAGDAHAVFDEIMSGEATPAQIGALLTALRMKGETIDEITGAAQVMREKATPISTETLTAPVVDTCGTGGDARGTFNISTATAFVVAGAGVPVAKHGNRAMSSHCGSADVLAELGVNVEAPVDVVEECLREANIGFLFAPALHGAMKYAGPVRREIGLRTVFNVLGPLTNPAGATRQLIGVFASRWLRPLAETLKNLGSEIVYVVHGEDGLDEITLTGPTDIAELADGVVREYTFQPKDVGLDRCAPEDLRGGDVKRNAHIVRDVLSGKAGPQTDIVLINAAHAIVAGGAAEDVPDGLAKAREAVSAGHAEAALKKLIEVSNH